MIGLSRVGSTVAVKSLNFCGRRPTYAVVSLEDNSENGNSCMNADGLQMSSFTFIGATLNLAGKLDYETCKDGLIMGVKATSTFTGKCSLLSATKAPWPQVILDLYTWLSAFNFNINITAPECAFELAYEDKWRMIMAMPALMLGSVFIFNWVMVLLNKFVLNKRGKDIYAHSYRAFGIAVTIMYYIYLNLSMTALEVFNCSVIELEDPLTGELVSDGKQYMQETNWVCYEEGSLQVFLIPYAFAISHACGIWNSNVQSRTRTLLW